MAKIQIPKTPVTCRDPVHVFRDKQVYPTTMSNLAIKNGWRVTTHPLYVRLDEDPTWLCPECISGARAVISAMYNNAIHRLKVEYTTKTTDLFTPYHRWGAELE